MSAGAAREPWRLPGGPGKTGCSVGEHGLGGRVDLFMVSSAAELTPPHAPGLWRRYLALAIDGLRTPDPHPLPQPGLSPDELDVAVRRAHARAA
jgi:hypothetical protein